MERTFEEKIDIVDALQDGQAKLDFLAHAYSSLHNDQDVIPGPNIVHGMFVILSEMAEQIGAVSKVVQHNLFEVESGGGKRVLEARRSGK